MHIVDVAEFYAPLGGGVKTYIDAKLSFAARHGARVTVLAPGPEDREEVRPGGVVRYLKAPAIPIDRRYHLFAAPGRLHAELDALRPDVVEASSFMMGAVAVATWRGAKARAAKKALVLHADFVAQHPGTWFSGIFPPWFIDLGCFWYWGYLKAVAAGFDRLVAGTRWMAGRVKGAAGLSADVVPWGIDLALFDPARRDPVLRAELLESLSLPETGRLLVGIGRHHHEKRWPMLMKAVGAAGRVAPIGMVQLGDGFGRAAVEKAAAKAGNVRLLGHVPERETVARILASADGFAHASSAETFGLVASEALASGVPLVLPDAGGCTDAADPRWGESYRAGDWRAARDAVLRLSGREPAALFAAAREGRRARVISTDEHFRRLFALYGAPVPPASATPALADLRPASPGIA
jgi:alpha-1,6-mannosyltransferase